MNRCDCNRESADPRDQGGMPEPEDPRDQGGMPEPEDPRDQGGMPEPEDPRDQGGMPEPEDPEARGGGRLWQCGGRRGARPGNAGRGDGAERYSGFIVVRLAASTAGIPATSLGELAEKLELRGLSKLLDKLGVAASPPLVRGCDPKQLLRLERQAERSELPPLHSLTTYWRIDVRDRPKRAEKIVAQLGELVEVDLVYRELEATDPVVNAADDTYAGSQGHLDAAPVGIDARWAWTQPNGEGAGVAVIDLEQGWFPNHEDLVAKSPTLIHGDNRDGIGGYKGNHGTAVLGEMIAADNTVGVVGIAPAVTSVRMVSHYDAATNSSGLVADAIVAAIAVLDPGDVLLLEIQKSYKPTEIEDADFDAIRLAVAHGIVVVEAAGNGSSDLDAYTNGSGHHILDRTSSDFRDSGAILVGAALSALPHNRKSASNFGSRLDCYAWGNNVVTCGYGDLDAGAGDDETYTADFQNTSAASPIIAGAALVVQGRYQAITGTRLSPVQMRAALASPATGTPQGGGVAGNIGVMPDLRAIFQTGLGVVPDLYLRDHVGDTGAVPATGSISASPDVIVRPATVLDPAAAFGEGSGAEGSATLGFEVEAGQDNFLYVRVKNRGSQDANGVTATVYWSEVATLVTPDLWHPIGTTAPVNVPQGDTLVVAGPLTWPAADIPATGHYCFVAILDHPQDPAPPLPPGPPAFDWNGFRSFVRNHNNVTWRNFNVVDALPDPAADPAALPFLLAGTPEGDQARVFDLEVLQRLPEAARVWLEVPLALGRELDRGTLWKSEIDRERQTVRIRLPAQPRVALCSVRLASGARHRCRFLVQTAAGMKQGGHGVAIRQLYRGWEVGRVTWQFHRRRKKVEQGPC